MNGKITVVITERVPCLLEPRKIQITAQADRPLGEVIPILYLAIPRSQYAKAFNSVTFTIEGKLVTVYSDGKIKLGCVLREEVAVKLLDKLKAILDKAYEYYMAYGAPNPRLLEARQRLNPLEIYKYLPKTNCRECGEQGCYPFAVKLANGEKTIQACTQIQLPKYSDNKAHLERVLQPVKLRISI